MNIIFTPGESAALAKNAEVLLALANQHDAWQSEADSIGFEGSAQTHAARRKELRAAALRIVQIDPDCWPESVLRDLGLPITPAAQAQGGA